MKRKFEELHPKDLSVYRQTFKTQKDAKAFVRYLKNCAPNSDIHLRRGRRVVVKTAFSADAWVLTLNMCLSACRTAKVEPPAVLWQLASNAVACARKGWAFFPSTEDNRRISCHQVISMTTDYITQKQTENE